MNAPASPAHLSPKRALFLLRSACLPAMAASAALAVEYRSLDSSFCGPDSGCSALRRTELAYLWGLGPTLPELGLLAFLVLFALSLVGAVRAAAVLSIVGGVLGLGLLAAQAFDFGTFCWLCVVVDLSAVVAGGAGGAFLLAMRKTRSDADLAKGKLPAGAWAALGVLAIAAPAFWPALKPAPAVPASVRAYYEPDRINVIEFADFECPFCRRLHQELKELLEPYGSKVHFVRLNMPLPRHPHAKDAALAAICAEPSGHADALAEFMFTSEDLSLGVIRKEAARLGVDLEAFDRCRQAPESLARLERESRILHDVGFQGLPTTYIGGRRIVGAQSAEVFQDALERAARQSSDPGVPAWAYLLIVSAIGVAIVYTATRSKTQKRAPEG